MPTQADHARVLVRALDLARVRTDARCMSCRAPLDDDGEDVCPACQ